MTAREVVLEAGPPWGFRMHGGADVNQPLRISRVNPGSKAAHRGIREGDLISSINGQGTKELTNSEAHGLLKSSGDTLKLGLNEDAVGSPKRKQYRTVHQETLQETVKKSSFTTYSIQKTVETVETFPGRSNDNTLSRTNDNTKIKCTSKSIPPGNTAISERSTLSSNSSSSSNPSTLRKEGTSKSIPPGNTAISERSTLSSNSSSSSNPSTLRKEESPTATSPDNAEASRRSSYTNCTLSPSTVSTLSEDGNCSRTTFQPHDHPYDESAPDMNDSNLSRSQKRRQRRKNRKLNDNQCDNIESNPSLDNSDKIVAQSKFEVKNEYRVDSPGELAKQKKKLSQNPAKSKSLDDDDMIKIQELSEASESEDKDNQAIISEAPDSDVDCNEVTTLKAGIQSSKTNISTLTLSAEKCNTLQTTLMSPEEEKTLRNFLGTLNLVNGPEEAAKQVLERNPDNPKCKKIQRRAALEEYFLPMCQNPRYLDAISEEASDKDSDREQPTLTKHLRRGTPELEEKPPEVPPRNKVRRRVLPKRFVVPIEQPPAVLVGAKIFDNPKISEGICSTMRTAEASSTVEIVYLDSSESNSPSEFDSTSNDTSDKASSNEEININETKLNGVSSSETDTLDNGSSIEELNKTQVKSIEISRSTKDNFKGDKNAQNSEVAQVEMSQNGMVTCKKDSLAQESKTYEELSGENETITTSSSTRYNFLVRTKEVSGEGDENHTILENGIMSQLTPPPTPESLSPKNGIDSLPCLNSFDELTIKSSTDAETKDNPKTEVGVEETKDTESYKIFISRSNRSNNNLSDQNSAALSKTRPNNFGSSIIDEVVDLSSYRKFMRRNSGEKDSQDSYKSSAENGEKISQNLENKGSSNESLASPSKTYKRFPGPTENYLLVKENATVYTNVLSPPPPSRSPSVSSSSSRDSSLCTAKYNPLNSSLADVTSISKEEEQAKETPHLQPLSLREICLKFLITLPFGADILQELADVSLSIESFTNNLPSTFLPKLIPNLPAFVDKTHSDPINDSSDISVKMKTSKEWVGIPTEKDPKLLVCLSPKQRDELEKNRSIPDEADKLLDLHEKFVNRRSCQEDVKKEEEEKVTITNVSRGSSSVNVMSPTGNRLLGIIREEPCVSDDVEDNYLYFEEKAPKGASATLPRLGNNDDARLKAKNLTEWLSLARNKSMSESNLNTVADIPENNLRKDFNALPVPKRRTSLPYDLYERQMLYLQEKEREIQRELEQLEEEKRKVSADMASSREFQLEDFRFSRRGDFAEIKNATPRPASMPAMPTEVFRQQMYEEYMDKFAEREERKQQKVIKVTSCKDGNDDTGKGKEIVHPIHIEKEFLEKVKQKQMEGKLGKTRDSVGKEGSLDKEKEDGEPVLVIDGEKLKGTKQLPRHLQEFLTITKEVAQSPDGIWAPGQRHEPSFKEPSRERVNQKAPQDEAILPVWTPKSANSSPTAERKEFRPVNFQSPVLSRKTRTKSESFGSESPSSAPPWKIPDYSSDTGIRPSYDKRIPTSHSSPASGFIDFSTSPRLPKAQNPTITLLQKAREGQLPRGAAYIEQEQKQFKPKNERPPIATPGDVLYQIKHEYTSESDSERPRKMADLGSRKFEGIGPVTKDGMPLILRSEIKDQNQSKWYKRMYDTIHKQKPHNDEYVTVRYKQRRAQYPYSSGYLSEPEPGAYDSDFADYKYQTLDRRRPNMQERHFDYTTSSTMPRSLATKSSPSDVIRNIQEPYKMQPGRIENYTPGHSSISEKEAKEWWDEVMDIFDGHLEQQKRVPAQPRSFINQALKESGYESDSTLVFRRREEAAQQINPKEQREAYKVIQKGGDVPLHGLRRPAPERPKDPEPPVPPPKGHQPRNIRPGSTADKGEDENL